MARCKGEEADIEVRVTKVAQQELPELDDEFAQLASEFDTLDELRADLRGPPGQPGATRPGGQRPATRCSRTCSSQVEIDVPENVVDAEFESRKTRLESSLQNAQLDLEEYLADGEPGRRRVLGRAASSAPPTRCRPSWCSTRSPRSARSRVDQNDLTQHIIRRAQQENTAPQQIADHLQEHPHHIDEYMTEIRRGKALAVLVEARRDHRLDGRAGRPRPVCARTARSADRRSRVDDENSLR